VRTGDYNGYRFQGNDPQNLDYDALDRDIPEWAEWTRSAVASFQTWAWQQAANYQTVESRLRANPMSFGGGDSELQIYIALHFLANPQDLAMRIDLVNAEQQRVQAQLGQAPSPSQVGVADLLGAGLEGTGNGATLVANEFTGGFITPLNDYSERLIQENGPTYRVAAGLAVFSRETLILAATLGTGEVLEGARLGLYTTRGGQLLVTAARVAQPLIFARDVYFTAQAGMATYDAYQQGNAGQAAFQGVLTFLSLLGTGASGWQTIQAVRAARAEAALATAVGVRGTAAIDPRAAAAASSELSVASLMRALRQNGSPEALATASLIKRGRLSVVISETAHPQGYAGLYLFGTDYFTLYKPAIGANPSKGAGFAAHEAAHFLQDISVATYHQGHELEAYLWQKAADAGFSLRTEADIWAHIWSHPEAYGNLPAPPTGWQPDTRELLRRAYKTNP
jgi:hypothetical protein